jgi:hypothetical protein
MPEGPHVRLGLAWFAGSAAAVAAGPFALAVWLAAHAALAAAQVARSHGGPARGRPPLPPAAAAAAAGLVVVGSGLGPLGLAAGLVAGGVVVMATASAPNPLAAARAVLSFALSAAALVLARRLGSAPAFAVLALAGAHDAGNYLVGTGAGNAWEGPAAALAAMAATTLAVAAAFSPPLTGTGPVVLGGVALVAAPAGPLAASALLGDRAVRVPAVRRLDSLLLLAPAGLAVTAAFVR